MAQFRAFATTKTAAANNGGSATLAVAMPGAPGSPVIQVGDQLVVYGNAFGSNGTLTPPAGWKERLGANLLLNPLGGRGTLGVWFRVATSADAADPPPSYTWTMTATSGAYRAVMHAVAYSDAGPSLCGHLALDHAGTGAGPFATDTIDLMLDNTLVAAVASSRQSGTGARTWTQSTGGDTERVDDNHDNTDNGSLAVYDAAAVDSPPPATGVSRGFTPSASVTSAAVGLLEIPDATITGTGPVAAPTTGGRTVTTNTVTVAATSWTVPVPANLAVDDLVIVALGRTNSARTVAAPAGFTPLSTVDDSVIVEVFLHRAAAGESGDYTFTVSGAGDTGVIACIAYPGVNWACPIGDVVTATQPTTIATHTTGTGLLYGVDSWVVSIVGVLAAASGLTMANSDGSDADRLSLHPGTIPGLYVHDSNRVLAQGSTPSRVFTRSTGTSTFMASVLIEVMAGSTAPPLVIAAPPAELDVEAPPPVPVLSVPAPPATVALTAPEPDVGGRTVIAAPPAELALTAPAPAMARSVAAPPATVALTAPVPDVTLTHITIAAPPAELAIDVPVPLLIVATLAAISPIGGILIPALRPRFEVTVVSTEPDVTLEIQVDTDEEFPDPTELSASVPTGQATIRTTLQADEDLADDTVWWWRARLVNPFDATAWTAAETFATSTPDGDGLAAGTWTVEAGVTPQPHLWFVRPDRGRDGDSCIAVGTGFGPTTATVTIAGQAATVTDFTDIDPTADAYTADRAINPTTGRCDPGHQRVTFLVPDVPYPGGVLYIDGS